MALVSGKRGPDGPAIWHRRGVAGSQDDSTSADLPDHALAVALIVHERGPPADEMRRRAARGPSL